MPRFYDEPFDDFYDEADDLSDSSSLHPAGRLLPSPDVLRGLRREFLTGERQFHEDDDDDLLDALGLYGPDDL